MRELIHISSYVRKVVAGSCLVLMSVNAHAQVQKRTGGDKEDYSSTLQVYPNPTTGKITISVREQEKAFHINIYNLIGEMVFHWESGNSTNANFEADLSRKPDGVYFVELDTEKANVLKRIIVDRNN